MKKILQAMLSILYDEENENPDYELLEQVILRYAYHHKYVAVVDDEFILTKKGEKLCNK